jgi:acyl carrier protein
MSSTMTDEAICRLIQTAAGRAAARPGVAPGMSLRADLGIDSIGLMSVVFMLEEEAGIDAFSHVQQFIGAEYVADIIKIVRQA